MVHRLIWATVLVSIFLVIVAVATNYGVLYSVLGYAALVSLIGSYEAYGVVTLMGIVTSHFKRLKKQPRPARLLVKFVISIFLALLLAVIPDVIITVMGLFGIDTTFVAYSKYELIGGLFGGLLLYWATDLIFGK